VPRFDDTYPSIAIVEGDSVDIALEWEKEIMPNMDQNDLLNRLVVVNMAHDRKPGGEWETGTLGHEESFARRSSLVLKLAWNKYVDPSQNHYPIPALGGIYTPNVGM